MICVHTQLNPLEAHKLKTHTEYQPRNNDDMRPIFPFENAIKIENYLIYFL